MSPEHARNAIVLPIAIRPLRFSTLRDPAHAAAYRSGTKAP